MRRAVRTVLHTRRVHEVVAKVRNVFQKQNLVAKRHMVEHDQVLMDLRENMQ